MYLEVSPSGGKWWRLKYRSDGKEKRLSLGTYPQVTLLEARRRRDEAKRALVRAPMDLISRTNQISLQARQDLAMLLPSGHRPDIRLPHKCQWASRQEPLQSRSAVF